MSQISLFSMVSKNNKVLLGEGEFELSQFAGKIKQSFEVPLVHGLLQGGKIQMQVSICPINQAHTVGVDTRLLLQETPSAVLQK